MRSGKPADATALLARARLWPEHLGSGRPYDPDTRAEDYLEALIREERGDAAGRDSLLTAVVAFTRREGLRSSPQHLLGAAALRRLGREDDGRAILQQWREREPQNAASEYCLMVFTRQTERAGNLEMSLRASLLHRSTGNQELVLMNDFITAGLLP
jgi:hypothetical protein